MYFLFDICTHDSMKPIWDVVGVVVKAIWIGVPILLIIFGMVDLGKAVIASKEDEIKKATQRLGKRFLSAVAVFLVVWLVGVVLSFVSEMGLAKDADGNKVDLTGWKACWTEIID